nr:thioester dehydrase [Neisseria sp. HSC-16F19]
MVLLDSIEECGEQHIVARAEVGPRHMLLTDGVLPCMAGIEIMAQGIAAWAGYHAVQAGEPVRLGFLLGTRKLQLFADSVPVGTQLRIEAAMSLQDAQGFGVFDCALYWTDAPNSARAGLPENGLLVQAALNVYNPPDGKVVFQPKMSTTA